jgi:hypothetical protein
MAPPVGPAPCRDKARAVAGFEMPEAGFVLGGFCRWRTMGTRRRRFSEIVASTGTLLIGSTVSNVTWSTWRKTVGLERHAGKSSTAVSTNPLRQLDTLSIRRGQIEIVGVEIW